MPDPSPGLMTIVGEALEHADPAARSAYVDRACGADVALRRRVEELLAAHAGAGRFPAPDSSGALAPTLSDATATFAADSVRPA
jgi:hypothetical protein